MYSLVTTILQITTPSIRRIVTITDNRVVRLIG